MHHDAVEPASDPEGPEEGASAEERDAGIAGSVGRRKDGHVHSFGIHPHHNPQDPEPPRTLGVRLKDLSGYTLTFVVGFNPCILVIPCIYGAAQINGLTLLAVTLAFAVSTVVSMVAVTMLGRRGTLRLTSPFLTRYGEALSGGIIALTGIVLLLAGP